MKKYIQILLLLWVSLYTHYAFAGLDSLQRIKVRKEIESLMDKQKAQNLENDRLGKSHLNNYVIDYQKILDDDESEHFKIKEANGGKTLWNLQSDAFIKETTGIKSILSNLNAGRSQNDKIYVVLISIYDYKRDVIRWYKSKNRYTQDYESIDKISGQNWSTINGALTQKIQNQSQINSQSNEIDAETFKKNNLDGKFVTAIMRQKIGSKDFSDRSIACFSHYQIVFDKNGNSTYKVKSAIHRFTSIPKGLLDLIDTATSKFDLQGSGRNDALREIVSILATYDYCNPDDNKFNAEVQRINSFLDTELTKLPSNTQSGIFITPIAEESQGWRWLFDMRNKVINKEALGETQKKIQHLEEKTGYKICVIIDHSDENICDDLIAKSIFVKNQKLDKSKTILIYVRLETIRFNPQDVDFLYKASLGHHVPQDLETYIESSNVEMANSREIFKKSGVEDFAGIVANYIHNNIYRPLPKPAVVYAYQINFKGEIVELPIQKSEKITGLDIYNLVIVQDRRIKTAINAYKSIKRSQDYLNSTSREKPPQVVEQEENNIIAKKQLLEQLEETPSSDGDLEIIDHQIKESYLRDIAIESFQTGDIKYNPIARRYTRWLLGTYVEDGLPNVFFENFLPSSPPNDAFIAGNNAVKIARVKEKIDEASLALSPFGVDFIADGLGAVYCFVNNDTQGTLLYAGFALVGSADKIVKIADKTYDIVRRTTSSYQISLTKQNRVYSTFFPLIELTQVTPLFKNSTQVLLSERFLEKVRSLGLSKAEIKALDKDLFNNRSLIDAMNADVDFLDVWKEISYLKQHRKEIDFLKWVRKVNSSDPEFEKLRKHIFEGEPSMQGSVLKVKGVHHKLALTTRTSGFLRNDIRIKPGAIVTPIGTNGCYRVQVEIFDGVNWNPKIGPNGGEASFFPDTWTKQQVLEEIALARSKTTPANWQPPIPPRTSSNTYHVILTSGETLEMYIGQPFTTRPSIVQGNFISAFPTN